jgi:hypothetical protein
MEFFFFIVLCVSGVQVTSCSASLLSVCIASQRYSFILIISLLFVFVKVSCAYLYQPLLRLNQFRIVSATVV